jgi:hypothetical protein
VFTEDVSAPGAEPETPEPSFGKRLFDLMFGRQAEVHLSRLESLNAAIAAHPDAPANYVLRGELFMGMRAYPEAARDFQTALRLAEAEIEESDWGLVAQAMGDRAVRGLSQARERLPAAEFGDKPTENVDLNASL